MQDNEVRRQSIVAIRRGRKGTPGVRSPTQSPYRDIRQGCTNSRLRMPEAAHLRIARQMEDFVTCCRNFQRDIDAVRDRRNIAQRSLGEPCVNRLPQLQSDRL